MPSTPFIAQQPHTPDACCLDAELLAAYIDGRVTAAERREVEAHLARCGSCQFVFAETFQEWQTAAKPNRTVWMAAGLAGLAVAATLGLAV